MATLYVTEFISQGTDFNNHEMAAPAWPSNTTKTIAVGASSASCTTFQNGTALLRLSSDTTCSYTLGATPTATTTGPRLPANVIEYVCVPAGQNWSLAVIANS
jgi:hypothetical protein